MRRTLLLILLIWLVSGVVHAQDPRIRWSVRTHPGLIAGLKWQDFRTGRTSPEDVVLRLQREDFPSRLDEFLDLCTARGISEIILDGIQPELGGLYFHSEVLQRKGWDTLFDAADLVSRAAEAKGLRFGLSLTELGIHARGFYEGEFDLEAILPLERSDLEGLIRELKATYPLHSVSEEEFPAEWLGEVDRVSGSLDLRYVRRTNADDLVAFTSVGQRTTPLRAFQGLKHLSSRDFFPRAAVGQETGVANGSLALILPNINSHVETSTEFSGPLFFKNLILFRALANAPSEVTILAGPDEIRAIPADLFSTANQWRALYEPDLPVLNLVISGVPRGRLDDSHIAWLQLVANLEPILAGVWAAGYRPVLTEQPLGSADAYYVYLAGPEVDEWLALQGALEAKPDSPILIQPGSWLGGEVFWRLTTFLGLREAQWKIGPLPETAFFAGRWLNFRGLDLYEGRIPTGRIEFKPNLETLLVAGPAEEPLLYRNPGVENRWLVNGNLLSWDMAWPISQILSDGRGLQGSVPILVGPGKRTAFWALADGEVDWIHPRSGARIRIEMKRNGMHLE